MAVIQPEWRGAEKLPTEKSFSDRHGQPERHALQKLDESESGQASDLMAENMDMDLLIRRISSEPIDEIDRVVSELHEMRDTLRDECERMNQDIAHYVRLSHASMTTIQIIANSMAQRKRTPPDSGPRSAS